MGCERSLPGLSDVEPAGCDASAPFKARDHRLGEHPTAGSNRVAAGGAATHRNLSLADAYHLPCCEAADISGGVWELYGFGPQRGYSVLIRAYWGSRPTKAMQVAAERAIRTLRLPPGR